MIFCARNYVPCSEALIFSSFISTTVRSLTQLQHVTFAVLRKVISQVIRNIFSTTKIYPHNSDKKEKRERSGEEEYNLDTGALQVKYYTESGLQRSQ